VRCHCCLDIFDPEDEVTLTYFSTSVLCHGCRGYPASEENFFDFFAPEKEKKEKNSRESGRTEREEVMCQQKPVPGRKIGAL